MSPSVLSSPELLVRGLCKSYAFGPWWRRRQIRALDDVSLIVRRGRTLGVVGKSGSGKTTLATCLAGIERPDSGEIWIDELDLVNVSGRCRKKVSTTVQLVQQDAMGALSPRFTAEEIVEEPLRIQGTPKGPRAEYVESVMARVGLLAEWKNRKPHQFSGGQRQRLAIARALVLRPRLLILDEPFTGLDLSMRGQIINLLVELQAEFGLAYVYISHDHESVRHFADEVVVMDEGRVVTRTSPNAAVESGTMFDSDTPYSEDARLPRRAVASK